MGANKINEPMTLLFIKNTCPFAQIKIKKYFFGLIFIINAYNCPST
jgi:hypothetical protein